MERATPLNTSIDIAALMKALAEGTTSFGDGTGGWAPTSGLAVALWTDYGRVRSVLDDLAGEGVVRRHPSGADFWQIADGEA